jgi:hypothetical protein
MKVSTLRLAVLSIFGVVYSQAMAGFELIPTTTPITISGGTTAYIICNSTGEFGIGPSVKNPTTSPENTCYIGPAPASDLTAPISGFTLVTSANRQVTLNNTYSGNTNKNIGTLLDVVWRNAAQTECIYGTKFTANTTDYNTGNAGNQYFEANGIARGGFVDTSSSTARTVEVAYSRSSSTAEVVYRAGRTFTSVQHRPGDVVRPLTGLSNPNLSINGLDSLPGSASSTQQLADLNSNWVEFTTDVNARDDDGSTTASSAMFYIKTSCSSAAPVAVANAIRLRQTFQEPSTDGANPVAYQRFIEVPVTGFVPPNGAAIPTPGVPF